MAELRVHLGLSLDGFLAGSDGSTAFLAPFPSIGEAFADFIADIATLVMGRAAYDHFRAGGDWPFGDRRAVVVTSRDLPTAPDPVEPWLGDLGMLADELRAGGTGDVWVVGGGKAIRAFLDLGAIDCLDLMVAPLLLGAGRPLFLPGDAPIALSLRTARPYPDGVVRLSYRLPPVRHGRA